MRIAAILFLSLLILGIAAWQRPPEYDEAYSIFLTAGDTRPAWPTGIFHPADTRTFYKGDASPTQISIDLRKFDVHPPLYFWLLEYWRRLFGASWFAARMLSVFFAITALAGVAWAATLTDTPPCTAVLVALLSYGFAYTGIVARGFALAQALNILGLALILSATQPRNHARRLAFAGGLAFGAASFANYLAIFIAIAVLFWLTLQSHRRKLLLPAATGIAAFLPALIYFFLAQHHARVGQFQAFAPLHASALLAKDFGAAQFGGLPLYAGRAGVMVTAALLLLTTTCLHFVIQNWRKNSTLFALAVLSVPAGLLTLGIIFNNTPIEIRYLAFAIPPLALLLAQTLPPALRILLLCVQACGILGLILAPATMQPQARAARQIARLELPQALVLLPFGNDGVGIPGPFIAAAPDRLRLELLAPDTHPALATEQIIILAAIRADDSASKTTAITLARLRADPCLEAKTTTPLLNLFVRRCKSH